MLSKLNPKQIFKDHFDTLTEYDDRRDAWQYLCVTYAAPMAIGVGAQLLGLKFGPADFSSLISIFGIFGGLLLNLQVGLFAMFVRPWAKNDDPLLQDIKSDKKSDRDMALKEISTNISYLTLICIGALLIVFLISIPGPLPNISGFWIGFIVSHFVISLLLVIRGAYVLFDKEYQTA